MLPAMVRAKSYPLEPLVRVRRDRVDASARALASAIEAREAAERGRRSAEAERARHADEARRARESEAGALARGELSAADLQRQGAWDARVRWEDEERARRVAAAGEREATAVGAEGEARGGVAKAEAESKVVAEHRARWAAEGARAAEVASEEGAAEAWRPRR